MNNEEAIRIYDSKEWEKWTDEKRALFQLNEPRLCMPFDVFHKSIQVLLGRPVFSHEFAWPDKLKEEYESGQKISFTDVMDKIPSDKKVTVVELSEEE